MEYTLENYKKAKNNDVFEFVCQTCGKIFTKTKREIQKSKGVTPKYCSIECSWKMKDLGNIEVVCAECGKPKIIKKSEYNKSNNKLFFCNKSCSAKYNNRKYPKRKNVNTSDEICPICGRIKGKDSALCKDCDYKKRKDEFRKTPIGEYIGYDKKVKYLTNRCGSIRRDARNILIENNVQCECAICHNHDFDLITEAHHIKPITEFPPETLISEVNNVNNLVWLCPNHHKLVHLGILKI